MEINLTAFQGGLAPETLAYLERDRWPEFERKLRKRHNRKRGFLLRRHYGELPYWTWMIWQCRKWEEVEKVLNRHNVDYRWKEGRRVVEWDGAEINRYA